MTELINAVTRGRAFRTAESGRGTLPADGFVEKLHNAESHRDRAEVDTPDTRTPRDGGTGTQPRRQSTGDTADRRADARSDGSESFATTRAARGAFARLTDRQQWHRALAESAGLVDGDPQATVDTLMGEAAVPAEHIGQVGVDGVTLDATPAPAVDDAPAPTVDAARARDAATATAGDAATAPAGDAASAPAATPTSDTQASIASAMAAVNAGLAAASSAASAGTEPDNTVPATTPTDPVAAPASVATPVTGPATPTASAPAPMSTPASSSTTRHVADAAPTTASTAPDLTPEAGASDAPVGAPTSATPRDGRPETDVEPARSTGLSAATLAAITASAAGGTTSPAISAATPAVAPSGPAVTGARAPQTAAVAMAPAPPATAPGAQAVPQPSTSGTRPTTATTDITAVPAGTPAPARVPISRLTERLLEATSSPAAVAASAPAPAPVAPPTPVSTAAAIAMTQAVGSTVEGDAAVASSPAGLPAASDAGPDGAASMPRPADRATTAPSGTAAPSAPAVGTTPASVSPDGPTAATTPAPAPLGPAAGSAATDSAVAPATPAVPGDVAPTASGPETRDGTTEFVSFADAMGEARAVSSVGPISHDGPRPGVDASAPTADTRGDLAAATAPREDRGDDAAPGIGTTGDRPTRQSLDAGASAGSGSTDTGSGEGRQSPPAPAPRTDAPIGVERGFTAPASMPTASTGAATGSLPGSAPVPAPHAQIMRGIGPLLQGEDGTRQITLQLAPAHLGRVTVTVELRGGEVSVVMQAAEGAARDVLKGGVDDLRAQLTDLGLRPGAVDVDARSQSDSGQATWDDVRRQAESARRAALRTGAGFTLPTDSTSATDQG